ncbi:helix-turn-helix transcriptional regulator [Yersinia enterocolitica]|uniref:helix-turn-helix transcriptional regulator n=1 Tax=Yersinia enterocolitica TaxID=630 RepID=UPI00094B9408|nr:PAS and helix-turn-helix domain-containing protein [Yersinia enterocolitica]
MAGSHVRDPDEGSQPISIELITQHISSWERSHDPWGAKDCNYRFIYANQAYLELLNIPTGYDIRGCLEHDLRLIVSNLKDEYNAHERKVQELGDRVSCLEVNFFGRDRVLQPYFFDKMPFFDSSGSFSGTIIHGRKAEIYSHNLLLSDDSPRSLYFNVPNSSFTKREWDIIYFLLRGLSYSLIAQELNLSIRTVKNNVQRLFVKSNVKSVDALVSSFKECSYEYYFPSKYLHVKYLVL